MSNIKRLVSVILPIYNMEKYLIRCVTTVCSQTYQNIEIILVDDGSSDASLRLCKELQRSDERIKVIAKENGGVSTARNLGIKQAKGEWLMFVDPDDYLEPTIVEKLLNAVEEGIDIVACCCKIFDDKGLNDVNHFFCGNRLFVGEEKNELYFQLMQSTYGQSGKTYTAIGVPWGKLYRRDFLMENNLWFDTKLKRVQDNIFNMYAFFYARGIKYLDEALYKYQYEHMARYFKTYRKDYVEIFVAVREARYECLVKTRLIEKLEIRKFYLNETIINLVGILKNGVFHKQNKKRFSEKENEAERICKMECFKLVLSDYRVSGLKYNLCLFLIRNRLFGIFALIARLN